MVEVFGMELVRASRSGTYRLPERSYRQKPTVRGK